MEELLVGFNMLAWVSLHCYLGAAVISYINQMFLNHTMNVLELLKKFGMEDCKHSFIAMELNLKLSIFENRELVDRTRYKKLIRSL